MQKKKVSKGKRKRNDGAALEEEPVALDEEAVSNSVVHFNSWIKLMLICGQVYGALI